MNVAEIKHKVAELILESKTKWEKTFNGIEPPTQAERDEYEQHHKLTNSKIKQIVPRELQLSIGLTGCAKTVWNGDVDREIEAEFGKGNGVYCDSESGMFYAKASPKMVHKLIRFIDYKFPNELELSISPTGDWDDNGNPWFYNWNSMERYFKELEQDAENS
jgi:hypothetical protein